MKKFFTAVITLAITISLALLAQAKPRDDKGGPPPKGERGQGMEIMDTDKDGKISLQEWQDFHAKHFKKIDKNGDGFLTEDEKRPKGGPKPE